ncbi:MAG: HAD hydrolase family protein [Clostridiales bacterium]|nr:HAD hydrolase family protein [Clostridiales bacterium]
MDKKLIFLDIDGTLTPAGSNTPPESAMKAVKLAQAKGHKIFLCTGRNPAMLAPVLALGFDGAVPGAGGYVFTSDSKRAGFPARSFYIFSCFPSSAALSSFSPL